MKLYELTSAWQAISDSLIDSEGELISDDALMMMENIEGDMARKIDGICSIIRQNEADSQAAEDEADRLRKLAQSRSNTVKGLKAYLQSQLQVLGMTRYETELFRVRVQNNSRPSIRCTGDPRQLPEAYQRVTVDLDGAVAYEAWKAGTLPPGVVAETGTHLRIS